MSQNSKPREEKTEKSTKNNDTTPLQKPKKTRHRNTTTSNPEATKRLSKKTPKQPTIANKEAVTARRRVLAILDPFELQ